MRRKLLAAGAVLGVFLPRRLTAQPSRKTYRVGVLHLGKEGEQTRAEFKEFARELARRGFVSPRTSCLKSQLVRGRTLPSHVVLHQSW